MRFRDQTIHAFLDAVAAKRPTPGGGAVNALIGAAAAAAGAMVARYSAGRKKTREIEPRLREIRDALDAAQARLSDLADEDSAAYAAVRDAWALPADTGEQTAAREAAVADASRAAMTPPLAAAREALQALGHVEALSEGFNRNLAADLVVAAAGLAAAVDGALAMVEVNVSAVDDAALVTRTVHEIESMRGRAARAKDVVLARMGEILSP